MALISRRNDLDIEKALTAMALTPTLEAAVERLGEMSYVCNVAYLKRLRDVDFADRYQQRRRELAPKIEEQAALDWMDGAITANQVVDLAVERTREMLSKGQVGDPARVARDLQQVATQKMDKVFASQGRPQKIIEHRDHTEILRALQAMGVAEVIEGTANVVDDPPELSAGDG